MRRPSWLAVEPGRRSSPDEDRVDRLRLLQGSRNLAFEGREVTIRQVVGARQRGEIAVSALVSAEGNVNVSGTRPDPGRSASRG